MEIYKNQQYRHQECLIQKSSIFNEDSGNGVFMGKPRAFVLKEGMNNLYRPIQNETLEYFRRNVISWWGGYKPSGHTLSSQIACLNHLFYVMKDKTAVLAILNGIRDEFSDVLPVNECGEPEYIGFEVVSESDHLNEKVTTRGANCTSIDAFIYAVSRKDKRRWLIPIEWKFTEAYADQDKSNEDRPYESEGSNGRGKERVSRYAELISASGQLKHLSNYFGSVYFQEPFYQLMRQTLWAEQVIENFDTERYPAEDYLHVHVIPGKNESLLNKKYKVSGKGMEDTWRSMLNDQSKYIIIDPEKLMEPVKDRYPELTDYLKTRYW